MRKGEVAVAIIFSLIIGLVGGVQFAGSSTGNWNSFSLGWLEVQNINGTYYYLNGVNITDELGGTWGALIATTLNTGQGAYELYAMNQDLETSDGVTFDTLDTGQGANELYDMDQNVQTTDDVLFNDVNVTSDFYLNDENRTGFLWYRDDTPSGLDDHEFSGDFIYGTAGENLAIGELTFLDSDGKYWKSDSNSSSTMYVVALALETITADASGKLLIDGYLRDDTWSGWTIGSESPLYVGWSGGDISQTVPNTTGDQVQIIGYAIASKIIRFDPDSTVVEIA